MSDEQELIKARLGKLGIAPHREEEILRELSEHLEDEAAVLEARGVTREDAVQDALGSVSDWSVFRSEIVAAETAEDNMNYRTKVLWLPALGALTLSSVLLAVFQYAGLVPRFYWSSATAQSMQPFYTIYLPWLVALPVVGAATALWSQHAGGEPVHRLLAALSPPLAMLGTFLAGPFVGLLIYLCLRLLGNRNLPSPHPSLHGVTLMAGVFAMLASWVLLPAVGLLLGAALFLRNAEHRA